MGLLENFEDISALPVKVKSIPERIATGQQRSLMGHDLCCSLYSVCDLPNNGLAAILHGYAYLEPGNSELESILGTITVYA